MAKFWMYERAWVEVEADTLAEASTLLAETWPDDLTPAEIAPRVRVGPPGDMVEVYDSEDEEPDCICPPELLARGGFMGRCPAHA